MATPYSSDMVEGAVLLPLIERYCRRTGISERRFGLRCMHDGSFVNALRNGRMVRAATATKVREWIARRDSAAAAEPVRLPSEETKNASIRKNGPMLEVGPMDRSRKSEAKDGSDELKKAVLALFKREGERTGTDMAIAGACILAGVSVRDLTAQDLIAMAAEMAA